MTIVERISTLVRANINDLIDRAEDPEKVIKQLLMDMHSQLVQAKTQVAVSGLAVRHDALQFRTENSSVPAVSCANDARRLSATGGSR